MAKKKNAHPATKNPRELTSTEILGEDYMVRPIKGYTGIMLAAKFQDYGNRDAADEFDAKEFLGSIDTMIDTIFPKSDAKRIRARLLDPEDELDMEQIMETFTQLAEKASGNPTM